MKKEGIVIVVLFSILAFAFLIGFFGIENISACASCDGDGTPGNPYQINTIEELNETRNNLTAHYILMRDLDFEDDGSYNDSSNKADFITGEGWVPIGNETSGFEFNGTFDGKNFTISNLYINISRKDTGFFGHAGSSSNITNFGLVNVNVSVEIGFGMPNHGVLVGTNNGTISNSYSTGFVNTSFQAGGLVGLNNGEIHNSYSEVILISSTSSGGLVGVNTGIITNSYALVNVTSSSDILGGFVGWNNGGTISNSYATGNVEGLGSVSFGGFVGFNNNGVITSSYSTGSVLGNNQAAGFVGSHSGSGSVINNSYSTGNAVSVGSPEGVSGGFVGGIRSGATIINSYSTGNASGDENFVGGFVGVIEGAATINNSFWDIDTSGLATSAGGTGKTTAEMKDVRTFTNTSMVGLNESWDFIGTLFDDAQTDDIWNIDCEEGINGGYPFLTEIENEDSIKWDCTSPETSLTLIGKTRTSITMGFSCEDSLSGISSCVLSSSSGSVNQETGVISGLSCGNSYEITLTAEDNQGNLATKVESISTDSCPGSGGGTPPFWIKTHFVFGDGEIVGLEHFEQNLEARHRLRFKVNNVFYYVGVVEFVENERALIRVMDSSEETISEESFNLGESLKFDLNKDGFYNLRVEFFEKDSETGEGVFRLSYIQEEVPVVAEEIPDEEISQEEVEVKRKSLLWIILGIILLVVIFMAFRRKKKK